LCRHYGLEEVAAYWEAVVQLNSWQQHRIARLVVNRLFGTVTGKRLAILGFAFKADTNDTREAPAIRICGDLLDEGAELAIYDPKVSEQQISMDLGQSAGLEQQDRGAWHLAASVIDAVHGADAVLVLTEWSEFASLPWAQIAAQMRRPAWVFDARSRIDQVAARVAGLNIWTVGQG
jgi:UDPglucose 6-dehydrogenase